MKHSDVTPLFDRLQQAKIKVLANGDMPHTVVLNEGDLDFIGQAKPNGSLMDQDKPVVVGMYAEAGSVNAQQFAILDLRGLTVYLSGEGEE